MTTDEFANLKVGDIVRNSASGTAYLVHKVQGDRVALVKYLEAYNPSEWEFVGPERMAQP